VRLSRRLREGGDELRARRDVQLRERRRKVLLDGLLRNPEDLRDRAIRLPGRDERRDFALASRQKRGRANRA
jgi:hypothetical protein